MTIVKDFNNEQDATTFRDMKRKENQAASIFTYGKDRYRVKVWEKWEANPERAQWALSDDAYKLSQDIEDLNRVKEIISSQLFIDCDYESVLSVATKLEKECWFHSPKDVIEFLEYPDKQSAKIKDMVETALKEYDDDWNDKSQVEVKA
jgi:hypothetical protein